MATITFYEKDLARETGIESLESAVDRLGMEIEGRENGEVTIGVTPNRPDLLDFTGLTRALKEMNVGGTENKKIYIAAEKPIIEINVGKSVAKIRPFIGGVVARGVNLKGNRLRYLIDFTNKIADTYGRKRRKIAIGLHDFSTIKGPLEYGAFTEGKMTALGDHGEKSYGEILEKTAKGQEYGRITGLGKGGAYPAIKDREKTIAVVPILNCAETEVREGTSNLLVEVTGSSRHAVLEIVDLLACSFIDSGAEVYPVKVNYEGASELVPKLEYREARIKLKDVNKTAGSNMTIGDVARFARMMGYSVLEERDTVVVKVPPYRTDFIDKQDIVEDVITAFGYENIPKKRTRDCAMGARDEQVEKANMLARFSVELGFTEAFNQYLTNTDTEFKKMRRDYDEGAIIRTEHPKTETLNILRLSILPLLMQNLGISTDKKLPQMLFEVGSVFAIENGKEVERMNLAMVSEHSRADFSEIKSVVVAFFEMMGSDIVITEDKGASFIDGRCAAIMVDGKKIGNFGEISPEVLVNFGLEEPVVACEISLEEYRW